MGLKQDLLPVTFTVIKTQRIKQPAQFCRTTNVAIPGTEHIFLSAYNGLQTDCHFLFLILLTAFLAQGKKMDFLPAKYSDGKKKLEVLRFLLPEEMFPTQTDEIPQCMSEERKMTGNAFAL